jgi:GAF domain-containing protein
MANDFLADIAAIGRIPAVPTILDVVCRTTGMGFAAVARVTEEKWIACSVRDDIAFGLQPGGELRIETTICDEIREHREPVVINNVAESEVYCGHQTPAMYGFQSYISVPILLPDGAFFGTLCAIDPKPHLLKTPEVTGMFKLFAELIAFHLDANTRLANRVFVATLVMLKDESAELLNRKHPTRPSIRQEFLSSAAPDFRPEDQAGPIPALVRRAGAELHRPAAQPSLRQQIQRQ